MTTTAKPASKVSDSLPSEVEFSEPVTDRFPPSVTLVELIELLLKDPNKLHWLARTPRLQPVLMQRFLAVTLIGYSIFGIVMIAVFAAAGLRVELTPLADWLSEPDTGLIAFERLKGSWWTSASSDASTLAVLAAYDFGILAAVGVCLPSFYFYSLLAGVQTTVLHLATLAVQGIARSALALVGILPIYWAVVLGMFIFDAPLGVQDAFVVLGLVLPFIAGLAGLRVMYEGFVGLCDTMRARRDCFLRRLTLSWTVCYMTVTTVMVYTFWEKLSRLDLSVVTPI